ncbi:MAG: DNA-processing protein DprA [Verrucomicrobiales bacterium]|nr:DNA-processing protein DprA [Verrucomicrobiales bacterium]
MTRREALLALNLLPRVGPVRVRRLLEAFGTPEAVFQARRDALLRIKGFGEELASILTNWEDHADLPTEERRIREFGAGILTADDEAYPTNLREIYDPPLVLYVWGALQRSDSTAIGVVGSRRATHYGAQCAKKLSFQLAGAGVTVLSGLARGIDTAAHEGAVAANGRTVAVIGSGLAKLYPPENRALAEKIAAGHGAVVSEFPMDLPPDKQTFPMRNRIVSGWSSGILVVEAPAWSGALITANMASEQGRSVYAVPGPIDRPTSTGCNRLIQQGAKLVMDARDVLEDLETLFPLSSVDAPQPARPQFAFSEEEAAVYAAIGDRETHVEEIITACELPTPTISATLLRLEMKRAVKQLPGRHYVRL